MKTTKEMALRVESYDGFLVLVAQDDTANEWIAHNIRTRYKNSDALCWQGKRWLCRRHHAAIHRKYQALCPAPK